MIDALLRELKVLDPVGIVHDQRLAQIVRMNHSAVGKRKHVEHASLHALNRAERRTAIALRRALFGDIADAKANQRHRERVEGRDDDFAALRRGHRDSVWSDYLDEHGVVAGVERATVRTFPRHEIALVAAVLIADGNAEPRSRLSAQLGRERLGAHERHADARWRDRLALEHLGDAREHVRIAAQHGRTKGAHLVRDGFEDRDGC